MVGAHRDDYGAETPGRSMSRLLCWLGELPYLSGLHSWGYAGSVRMFDGTLQHRWYCRRWCCEALRVRG